METVSCDPVSAPYRVSCWCIFGVHFGVDFGVIFSLVVTGCGSRDGVLEGKGGLGGKGGRGGRF